MEPKYFIPIDLTNNINLPQLIKTQLKKTEDNLEIILPKLSGLEDKETKNGGLDEKDSNMKTFLSKLSFRFTKLRIMPLNKQDNLLSS